MGTSEVSVVMTRASQTRTLGSQTWGPVLEVASSSSSMWTAAAGSRDALHSAGLGATG